MKQEFEGLWRTDVCAKVSDRAVTWWTRLNFEWLELAVRPENSRAAVLWERKLPHLPSSAKKSVFHLLFSTEWSALTFNWPSPSTRSHGSFETSSLQFTRLWPCELSGFLCFTLSVPQIGILLHNTTLNSGIRSSPDNFLVVLNINRGCWKAVKSIHNESSELNKTLRVSRTKIGQKSEG